MTNYAYQHSTVTPDSQDIAEHSAEDCSTDIFKIFHKSEGATLYDMSLTNLDTTWCLCKLHKMDKWCHCARIKRDNVLISTRLICILYIFYWCTLPPWRSCIPLVCLALAPMSRWSVWHSTLHSYWRRSRCEIPDFWYCQDFIFGCKTSTVAILEPVSQWDIGAPCQSQKYHRISLTMVIFYLDRSHGVQPAIVEVTGCVPFRSKRVCVGSLEKLKWLNVT